MVAASGGRNEKRRVDGPAGGVPAAEWVEAAVLPETRRWIPKGAGTRDRRCHTGICKAHAKPRAGRFGA